MEQAEAAIRHMASANRSSYHIQFSGGEPTTHPYLPEIIKLLRQHLGDRVDRLTIITNGSFSERQIEACLEAGRDCNLRLIVSMHLEYLGIERVVELVKRYSRRANIEIAIMFKPDLFDEVSKRAETLCNLRSDYPFFMYVSMLLESPRFDKYDSRYTQEHIDWVRQMTKRMADLSMKFPKRSIGNDVNKDDGFFVLCEKGDLGIEQHENLTLRGLKDLTSNVFTGLTCCAGINTLQIQPDGRCRGMICGLDGYICNIFEENPFEHEDWIHGVKCSMPMCGCNLNYRIPKFRSEEEAEKFMAEMREEQKRLMSEYQANERHS